MYFVGDPPIVNCTFAAGISISQGVTINFGNAHLPLLWGSGNCNPGSDFDGYDDISGEGGVELLAGNAVVVS